MADGNIELTLETIKTPEGINQLNRMLRTLYDCIPGDTGLLRDFYGYGSPEGVITAMIGSTYRRIDGGANISLYVKESGSGNSGWIAK